jgi:hypothetical protein
LRVLALLNKIAGYRKYQSVDDVRKASAENHIPHAGDKYIQCCECGLIQDPIVLARSGMKRDKIQLCHSCKSPIRFDADNLRELPMEYTPPLNI